MPELSTIVETGKNKHLSLETETMKEHWQLPVAASALLHSPEFVVLARRECALKLLIEGVDGTPKAITPQFSGVSSRIFPMHRFPCHANEITDAQRLQ
jgi:hypothetical protein